MLVSLMKGPVVMIALLAAMGVILRDEDRIATIGVGEYSSYQNTRK